MFDDGGFTLAMFFAMLTFLAGIATGIMWATEQWERGVINHGFGIYCPAYGEFAYINDECKPLTEEEL